MELNHEKLFNHLLQGINGPSPNLSDVHAAHAADEDTTCHIVYAEKTALTVPGVDVLDVWLNGNHIANYTIPHDPETWGINLDLGQQFVQGMNVLRFRVIVYDFICMVRVTTEANLVVSSSKGILINRSYKDTTGSGQVYDENFTFLRE